MQDADFATRLIAWQKQYGRHDLPWQGQRDAYAVWVSEIMLQQTQVETVIPYYLRFMSRFPNVAALAAAEVDAVLAHWSGLGYYARARNLHAAARRIMSQHGGIFPRDHEAVLALPGIGRSTAAAIAAFAFGERRAILDGNVKRVLARVYGIDGWPGERAVEAQLWQLADDLLPAVGIEAYTQGLMDFGATLCVRSRPRCLDCPFETDCVAAREGRQAELPGARPRKAIPDRHTAMLVLVHAGEILLEKRPPAGIWGGLWSLPECAADEQPEAAAARLGLLADHTESLPAMAHAFTHFRLHIRPWRIEVRRQLVVATPGQVWMGLEDALDAALPTPVRRLIGGMLEAEREA